MFFPCLMLAGSVGQYVGFYSKLVRGPNSHYENAAMGIMFLSQVSITGPYFMLPYFGLSLSLNIILTITIVVLLLTLRHRTKYGSQHTSITVVTIESASLYSVASIAFFVLFGIGNAVLQVFIQSLSQIQVRLVRNTYYLLLIYNLQTIATLLIVFRVVQGKGWTSETATSVMTAQGSVLSELGKMVFALRGASLTLEGSEDMEKTVGGHAA